MTKTLILCNCLETQTIDRAAISKENTVSCSRIYSNLCNTELGQAADEISKGNAIIACLQERPLFEELAVEISAPMPGFLDIRDRAGWSKDTANSGPKMAALVSDAMFERPQQKLLDITSQGQILIFGPANKTLPVATQLCEILSVTVLLPNTADSVELPTDRNFDVIAGHMKSTKGSLGNFELTIDALQQINTGGRGAFTFSPPRDGGQTTCDILLDLTGDTALFPAPQKRNGYLRADPRDTIAIAKETFNAAQLLGTFEQPFYIKTETPLCAHSRAQILGCSKCIDICPTGAIQPKGDHVTINPEICAGCGACSSLCPSGAITFDAPPTEFTFRRIQNMAKAYRDAGGSAPRLLVHDASFGGEMISLLARFGPGLPHDVIPLQVDTLAGFGHAEMLAALASGFIHVDILLSPKTEAETSQFEATLANAISPESVCLLDLNDPESLGEILYSESPKQTIIPPILAIGSRRQIARLAATSLNSDLESPIPLPQNAPYGTVEIDTDACTLCLSCAALCPTGALTDNPDKPQLRFQQDACLQCGLCTRVCPEKALTLKPQFDLSQAALSETILKEEEPFACIECGGFFGVKSTIEKISEKLAGKHPMFATSDTARLIQMCDHCRIEVQYKATDNPLQGNSRTKTVTTEDYISKRRDH